MLLDYISSAFRYIGYGLKIWKLGKELDTCDVLFHINFRLLDDYVEIEKAIEHSIRTGNTQPSYWNPLSKDFILRYRKPDLGVAALKLDIENKSNLTRSNDAAELLFLYNWYNIDRPKRLEISGPNANLLQEKYDDEDQEMLTRLVKVRYALWTD